MRKTLVGAAVAAILSLGLGVAPAVAQTSGGTSGNSTNAQTTGNNSSNDDGGDSGKLGLLGLVGLAGLLGLNRRDDRGRGRSEREYVGTRGSV